MQPMKPTASKLDVRIDDALNRVTCLLLAVPSARRPNVVQTILTFRPRDELQLEFAIGRLRSAFAEYWEARMNQAVPIRQLRSLLDPPLPIKTVLAFLELKLTDDDKVISKMVSKLVTHLHQRIHESDSKFQQRLFDTQSTDSSVEADRVPIGETVDDLNELVKRGRVFPAIYADPPWPYDNSASRGAAVNHYPTMSLAEICNEPIEQLAAENAHLHLWTTNAFLPDAFRVIDAWGFQYKSCFVWLKPEIGMGNYWRVSHEFLLLGMRGKLSFRNRQCASWAYAHRTIHSRKPGVIRMLVEKVSPGPYLELYGREELPDSAWTVYGNQIERRWF